MSDWHLLGQISTFKQSLAHCDKMKLKHNIQVPDYYYFFFSIWYQYDILGIAVCVLVVYVCVCVLEVSVW